MTMKIQLLLMVLLGVALAAPPTELRAKGGVIYNDSGLDDCSVLCPPGTPQIPGSLWVYGPALTFEVRLDTLTVDDALIWEVDGKGHRYGESFTRWNLYVTHTIGDTVRRFRVARLELIEEVP